MPKDFLNLQRLKLDDTDLSAIYSPIGDSKSLVILGHGAGAGLEHTHMAALSDALNNVSVGTLRFNFPFMELGKRRVDSIEVCIESIFQQETNKHNSTNAPCDNIVPLWTLPSVPLFGPPIGPGPGCHR